jgi:TetR/AcrR family transcriptional regulator, regulator of biofilm formation and stress response
VAGQLGEPALQGPVSPVDNRVRPAAGQVGRGQGMLMKPPPDGYPGRGAYEAVATMSDVRNEERRRQILEAAVRIIGRDGPSAVTHRAVAAEAGVPLAATTYYFSSKGQLFKEALTLSVQADLAELEALVETLPPGLDDVGRFAQEIAGFLVSQLRRRRTTVVAQYELVLEAAREPALRETARRSTDSYYRIFQEMLERAGSADPEGDARLLLAVLDGLLLEGLSAPRQEFTVDAVASQLRRVIEGLVSMPADTRR